MSGNAGNFAPISQTPPSTVGKGRVDLVKSDFDAAIQQKGYDVYLDRSILCPCKRRQDQSPMSSCRNCGGSGYVYINRYKTRMIIQAMNTATKFKDWSEEKIGSVRITARDEDTMSFMDRITLIGAKVTTDQVLFPIYHGNKVVSKTIYDIESIDEVFAFVSASQALKKLELNTDYTFSKNIITFSDSYQHWNDFTVSIKYQHQPTYHVIDMVRETMTTKIKTGAGEVNVVMPISAVGRKSHYVLDEQDYTGGYLLNNSYGASNSCGTDVKVILTPPKRLLMQHPTSTSIVLNWTDTETTETGFVIERSGIDGVWTTIASLPPSTTTYTDTVQASTSYFYRVAVRKGTEQSAWSQEVGVTTNA